MNKFTPWILIALAVGMYTIFAILSSLYIKRTGSNIKTMVNRTSKKVVIIGAVANITILITILLFIRLINNKSISSIGLKFSSLDLSFLIISCFVLSISAVVHVLIWRKTESIKVKFHSPIENWNIILDLLSVTMLLLIIAAQEEVLFRGYITLNLSLYSPWVIILSSTIIFAAIHAITNKISFYQFLSWFVGGVVLAFAYLLSGNIWVPIIFHFITDAINMMIFDIVGQFSILSIKPSLTAAHRAVYRISYAVITIMLLILFYGMKIRIPSL